MAERKVKGAELPNLSGRPDRMSRLIAFEKPKDARSTVKRLITLYAADRKMLVVSIVFIIISALLLIYAPYVMGKAVDTFDLHTNQVNTAQLIILLVLMTLIYTISSIFQSIQGYLVTGVAQRLVKNMRGQLFARLQKLPLIFFDTMPHGDLMSRLTNDTDNISQIVAQATAQLLTAVITITGTAAAMLMLNPYLTLASFVVMPIMYLLTKFITSRTRTYFKISQQRLGQLNGMMEETVSGSLLVKAFCREDALMQEFEDMNKDLVESAVKAHTWAGYLMPLMNVVNNLGVAVIVFAGAMLALYGYVTTGVITAFIAYYRQMSRPLNDMAGMINNMQAALAGAERVFEVIDEEAEQADDGNAAAAEAIRGDVSFKAVSFGYQSGKKVLRDISFEVKSGQSIAIVGPTGAGKTTIVNLLTRFYETDSGAITIDSRNIKQYTRQSLRRCFSTVLQDTSLFSGTIAENIRYSRPEATDEEVVKAAKTANAHEFISRLPKGYNTMIKGGAGTLSQGQRQLISIARAILCDASILILDEATSSVDTRTEFRIQEAMLRLMQGRTTFIIAHRLSTIQNADCIMVVRDGVLSEMGNHQMLMEKQGFYAAMYTSQCG